jgi:glycosyltransferase involved in cell wall biosynthesis
MLCEKVAEASFVVAISRYNQEVIAEECGDAALRTTLVLHCGVDTQRFRPRSAMAPAARPVPRLLCVGSLHEVKGQQHLIEACRLLRARGLELAVQLVGEGPDRAALARQINEAGLGDRIELTGTRTSVELAELLRGADLVATPSVPSRDGRREGIPVALMEAMATGLPVVASRLSGIPELVEHDKSGLLVEPGDVDGLADAIELLCSEPALRKRLGRAAREKVLSEFDLNANAAALAELFTSRSVS